jgi:hypothetical protein
MVGFVSVVALMMLRLKVQGVGKVSICRCKETYYGQTHEVSAFGPIRRLVEEIIF